MDPFPCKFLVGGETVCMIRRADIRGNKGWTWWKHPGGIQLSRLYGHGCGADKFVKVDVLKYEPVFMTMATVVEDSPILSMEVI